MNPEEKAFDKDGTNTPRSDELDRKTKLADEIEVTSKDAKKFGQMWQRFKENRKKRQEYAANKLAEQDDKSANFAKRYGGIRQGSWFKKQRKETIEKGQGVVSKIEKDEKLIKPRKGLFGRLREPGRFFSKERVKERHDFRIKVSGNRKWIMIGLAVVAICGTIIYLSITYGGGGLGFLKGVFK